MKPITCTVTVGGSPQRGVAGSGAAGHAGAGTEVSSQTATVRVPSVRSTWSGLLGQCAKVPPPPA
jgi:hypothetical protein